jgi:putative Ca2+/H+ antiporter (TMEM165/GDT1 family)
MSPGILRRVVGHPLIGTTLGMPIADVPAAFVGGKLAARIPMKSFHSIAAAILALPGVPRLFGAGSKLGFRRG